MKYFVLLACVAKYGGGEELCLVQHLQEETSPDGVQLMSEFDCPLLVLTSDLYLINPKTVLSPISVVHACDGRCTFDECSVEHLVERESINKQKLIFQHVLL